MTIRATMRTGLTLTGLTGWLTGAAALFPVLVLPIAPAAAEEAAPIAQEVTQEAVSNAASSMSPEATIEVFHTGLLSIMKEAKTLGFEGRSTRLEPLMEKVFDLDFMASKTVGRHWRKLTDADQQRWSQVFARLTTANYAGRFTGYTGERFKMMGQEEAARGTRLVLTKIVIPDEEAVEINYRLIEKDGHWRVIDVYLDGTVSELALRRSEYSSALKREGFEQLIADVEAKIMDLKAKGLTDG